MKAERILSLELNADGLPTVVVGDKEKTVFMPSERLLDSIVEELVDKDVDSFGEDCPTLELKLRILQAAIKQIEFGMAKTQTIAEIAE